MSSIQDLFQQAQLAESSYANFINPSTENKWGQTPLKEAVIQRVN